MKSLSKLSLLLLSLTAAMPALADKDPNLPLIEARQGEMALRAYFVGPLFAMAKGKIPYDADKAQAYADSLVKLMEIDMGRAWKQGTDKSAYPEHSDALPEIWTTYPEIGKYADKNDNAVKELAFEAGKGLDALRSKIGAVGKSCKSCHDEFRKKD
jgi:cytochrome c556